MTGKASNIRVFDSSKKSNPDATATTVIKMGFGTISVSLASPLWTLSNRRRDGTWVTSATSSLVFLSANSSEDKPANRGIAHRWSIWTMLLPQPITCPWERIWQRPLLTILESVSDDRRALPNTKMQPITVMLNIEGIPASYGVNVFYSWLLNGRVVICELNASLTLFFYTLRFYATIRKTNLLRHWTPPAGTQRFECQLPRSPEGAIDM